MVSTKSSHFSVEKIQTAFLIYPSPPSGVQACGASEESMRGGALWCFLYEILFYSEALGHTRQTDKFWGLGVREIL